MGVVVRNSSRLSTLSVLREVWLTRDLDAANLDDEKIYTVVDVRQATVRCVMCGSERTWYMGETELDALLASRKRPAEV